MNYKEAVKAFLAYAENQKGYAPKTIYAYGRILEIFGEQQNISDTSDINLAGIEAHLQYRREVLENSVNGLFNITLSIRAFCRYLARLNLSTFDYNLIDVPRRKRVQRNPLKLEEVQAILDNMHRERDRLMFLIMFATGLRVDELVHIKAEDIRGNRIHVIGKGSKPRSVPVHQDVLKRLYIYLNMERISSGLIFRTSTGKSIGPVAVRYAIRKAADRAGIDKRVYPHLLRHTFGAQYIENGGDVRSLQMILGHDQIQTTQIYMNMNDSWVNEQYEKSKPNISIGSVTPLFNPVLNPQELIKP